MIDREDIVDAVQMIDDPEELVADLVYEISYALETGEFGDLEELLLGIEEMVEIRDSQMIVKSWREFYSDEERDEERNEQKHKK